MKLKTLLEIYHRQASAMNVFESCCSEIRVQVQNWVRHRQVSSCNNFLIYLSDIRFRLTQIFSKFRSTPSNFSKDYQQKIQETKFYTK